MRDLPADGIKNSFQKAELVFKCGGCGLVEHCPCNRGGGAWASNVCCIVGSLFRVVCCRDGDVRESNARYIQWEDGSESIMLGDEILNIDRKDHSRAHTYLYAVRYDVIEGQAHLNQRATVAPASLNSKLHKRLKMTVSAATARRDKVMGISDHRHKLCVAW